MSYIICVYVAVPDDLLDLDAKVAETIASAWASSTLSVRNSQWKKFFWFCHNYNLVPLPADVSTVARFLVFIGQEVRYTTVNNYTSAVNTLHKFYGYELDFRSYYIIKLVLKGLKTKDVEGSMAKVPFTVQQLDVMYDRTVRTYHDELCWLSILLCFRTLLRKCNVLPSGNGDHIVLRREDVQFFPNMMVLTVHSSKTRHAGDEPLKIPIREINNKKFCVFSRLKRHFDETITSESTPLVVKSTSKGFVPLLYAEVLDFLKRGALNINIDPKRVGLHSLRRTGAMHLYFLVSL